LVRRSYQKKELDDLFDIIITSYRSKIAKPDIRIFKEGIKRLKIKPKEAIMIDDENDVLQTLKGLVSSWRGIDERGSMMFLLM